MKAPSSRSRTRCVSTATRKDNKNDSSREQRFAYGR